MKRLALIALVLASALSCDDSPTSPSDPNTARFTAILLPSNEVPAVTNADATASGTMEMTMRVTRDAANNVTGATYDFTLHMTGFPSDTVLTGAHIHNAGPNVNAGIVVPVPLAPTDTLTNGQGTITKTGLVGTSTATLTAAAIAQGIFNNPGGNYFNIHTSRNPGGAIRGQLVRME